MNMQPYKACSTPGLQLSYIPVGELSSVLQKQGLSWQGQFPLRLNPKHDKNTSCFSTLSTKNPYYTIRVGKYTCNDLLVSVMLMQTTGCAQHMVK